MTGQLALLAPSRPALPAVIDLRCCGCEAIDWPDADLIIADPPWKYTQAVGDAVPYNGLSVPEIVAHLARMRARRLALWVTWPLLAEWWAAFPRTPVSGGTWSKSLHGDTGHYGQGYHWAGCSEPVLLYTDGAGHNDRSALRNAWGESWVEAPRENSRKPSEWMAQWIRRWVPDGGLVCDPYAGLGAVAEAVLLAGGGRRYLGAEIDSVRHGEALALLAQVRA